MRQPLMALAIMACLVMSVVGGFIPILQGWIFFVIALYLLATEFETGRKWVTSARRRWPTLDKWIVKARDQFELVGVNELGEEAYGSPAISRGQIFIRGSKQLYCIGRQ